ncbi:MAG: hypothetical protein AAF999_12920 [Pseudomonadota bacterium]
MQTHAPQKQAGRKPTDAGGARSTQPSTGLQRRADRSAPVSALAALQRKADLGGNDTLQLRAVKYVTAHARSHYHDGWGANMGIQDDTTLKSKVPNSVTGSGSIDLGRIDAPDSEQDTEGRIKAKDCSIGYEDSRYGDQTRIFACGPIGRAYWRDA